MRIYADLNRGNLEKVGQALDRDVEVQVPPMLPDPGPFRGREEAERFFGMWWEIFDDFELVIEEMLDAGDRVLAMALVRGRGKDSGVAVETPSFGQLWTLRDGIVTRIEMYPTRAVALEALGLTDGS